MDRTTGEPVPAEEWELTGAAMPQGFGDGKEMFMCDKVIQEIIRLAAH